MLPGKVETTGTVPIAGGVPRDLTLYDGEAVAREVREVRYVSPISLGEAPARYGQKQRVVTVIGTTASFRHTRHLEVRLGRFLPEGTARQAARVCVIGPKIQRELFGGANPLGEFLLGQTEVVHQCLVGVCFLDRVQSGALDVFDQR